MNSLFHFHRLQLGERRSIFHHAKLLIHPRQIYIRGMSLKKIIITALPHPLRKRMGIVDVWIWSSHMSYVSSYIVNSRALLFLLRLVVHTVQSRMSEHGVTYLFVPLLCIHTSPPPPATKAKETCISWMSWWAKLLVEEGQKWLVPILTPHRPDDMNMLRVWIKVLQGWRSPKVQAVLKSEKNQTSQYCTLQYSRNSDTKYHSFSTEDENQDVIGIRHFFLPSRITFIHTSYVCWQSHADVFPSIEPYSSINQSRDGLHRNPAIMIFFNVMQQNQWKTHDCGAASCWYSVAQTLLD